MLIANYERLFQALEFALEFFMESIHLQCVTIYFTYKNLYINNSKVKV